MLAFLHLAAVAGVNVVEYVDDASGAMEETAEGGAFREVVLRPHVTVETAEMAVRCEQLHDAAHAACFIASSVAFPVRHEPTVDVSTR
jgi:organic hydroperoxide reductase OsmC/OhrA